jgi:hypothetical protein
MNSLSARINNLRDSTAADSKLPMSPSYKDRKNKKSKAISDFDHDKTSKKPRGHAAGALPVANNNDGDNYDDFLEEIKKDEKAKLDEENK